MYQKFQHETLLSQNVPAYSKLLLTSNITEECDRVRVEVGSFCLFSFFANFNKFLDTCQKRFLSTLRDV